MIIKIISIKLSRQFYLALLLIGFTFISCNSQKGQEIEIRGIYGNPKPFWDQGLVLSDLGVNAIFVHSGSIDHEMVDKAKQQGLKIYAEFATLNGKDYVKEHPEAWAIDDKGNKVEAASWFMGVCPTEPGFRNYRFGQLQKLLADYDLDGVWMDYVHWHAQFEEPEPILPETCFCSNCLDNFSRDYKIEIPEGTTTEKAQWVLNNHSKSWRNWRCEVIYDWSSEFRKILKKANPKYTFRAIPLPLE